MSDLDRQQAIIISPSRLLKLAGADLRNILRDPTLLAVLVFSFAPLIIFLFFKTPINNAAFKAFGLHDISIFAAPVFLLMPSYLIGWIIGFLILEERDEGPLLALETTPVGKQGIAAYRALLAFTLTFLLSLMAAPVLFPSISILPILLLAVFSALEATMITFALPAIANNKVQGLAFTKIMNLFTMAALLAIFTSPWRYLAGIMPAFWVGEFVSLSSTHFLGTIQIGIIGLAVHLVLPMLFYRHLLTKTI